MADKKSAAVPNPWTGSTSTSSNEPQRVIQYVKYKTKTLGWRDEDQRALDKLRGKIAGLDKGLWSERDVVGAALRHALAQPEKLER